MIQNYHPVDVLMIFKCTGLYLALSKQINSCSLRLYIGGRRNDITKKVIIAIRMSKVIAAELEYQSIVKIFFKTAVVLVEIHLFPYITYS